MRALPRDTITLGVRIPHENVGGHRQSPQSSWETTFALKSLSVEPRGGSGDAPRTLGGGDAHSRDVRSGGGRHRCQTRGLRGTSEQR